MKMGIGIIKIMIGFWTDNN